MTGPSGTDGANGATGATGARGPSGTNGTTGATGPRGPTGSAGESGSSVDAFEATVPFSFPVNPDAGPPLSLIGLEPGTYLLTGNMTFHTSNGGSYECTMTSPFVGGVLDAASATGDAFGGDTVEIFSASLVATLTLPSYAGTDQTDVVVNCGHNDPFHPWTVSGNLIATRVGSITQNTH